MTALLLAITIVSAVARTATTPFILVANHVYFRVAVNDNVASSFLLDTGAGASVIDRDHAEVLNLPLSGHGQAHGTGEETVRVQLVSKPRVSFGGIEVPLQYLAAVPLTDLSLRDGRMMQGVIGYDVLSQYTVTIDYARSTLTFEDPRTFKAPQGAVAVPLSFVKNTPVIEGAVTMADGRTFPVRILVDTGSRGALRLNTPFVTKYALDQTVPNAIEGLLGVGVGGTTHEKVGRIASVAFAGFVLKAPVASFAEAKSGTDAETEFSAQIGGEILRRFTVVVDYPRKRFLLTPDAAFSEPFEYDMSGMLVVARDLQFKRFVVKNVMPSSPAAVAGIAVGDELVAIDKQAASSMTLSDIRALFMRPGTHELTIMRGGNAIGVTLAARRLV